MTWAGKGGTWQVTESPEYCIFPPAHYLYMVHGVHLYLPHSILNPVILFSWTERGNKLKHNSIVHNDVFFSMTISWNNNISHHLSSPYNLCTIFQVFRGRLIAFYKDHTNFNKLFNGYLPLCSMKRTSSKHKKKYIKLYIKV